MTACALVTNLLDRSKIANAVPEVRFVARPEECEGASTVVIDLFAHADAVEAARTVAPDARIVCFASHVDDAQMSEARTRGADVVLPRSRFFRDVAAALGSP